MGFHTEGQVLRRSPTNPGFCVGEMGVGQLKILLLQYIKVELGTWNIPGKRECIAESHRAADYYVTCHSDW